MSATFPLRTDEVADLAPLVRRAVTLDPAALVRLRRTRERLAAFVRLPFGVLVARTVDEPGAACDTTVHAAELLDWIDGERAAPPERRDIDWRGTVPPATGWRRVETVPESVVRPLVRAGATTLTQSAEREGVPGAQPRAEVADALLDSVVLTVDDDDRAEHDDGSDHAEPIAITLRMLGALTRLGFLPSGSHVGVDVTPRWVRVSAAYGSVFAERPPVGAGARSGMSVTVR